MAPVNSGSSQPSSGADVSPFSVQQQQSPPPLRPLTMEGSLERGGANPPSCLTSEGWQVDRPAVAAQSSNPPSPPSTEGGSGGENLQRSLPGHQQKQQQSGPPHFTPLSSHARGVQGGLTTQQQQQTSPPTVSTLAHHAFNLYRECVGAGQWAKVVFEQRPEGEHITFFIRPPTTAKKSRHPAAGAVPCRALQPAAASSGSQNKENRTAASSSQQKQLAATAASQCSWESSSSRRYICRGGSSTPVSCSHAQLRAAASGAANVCTSSNSNSIQQQSCHHLPQDDQGWKEEEGPVSCGHRLHSAVGRYGELSATVAGGCGAKRWPPRASRSTTPSTMVKMVCERPSNWQL